MKRASTGKGKAASSPRDTSPEPLLSDQRLGAQPLISWTELSLHAAPSDLWVAIEGNAYNVTAWQLTHPGGSRLLNFFGGKDATEPFLAYHAGHSRAAVVKRMGPMRVGRMEARDPTQQAAVFKQMSAAVDAADLYRLNHFSYLLLYCYLATVFAATWYLLSLGGYFILPAAVTIGMFWGQLAFVGHDNGHRSVHGGRLAEDLLGCVVSGFLGIGASHWCDNHNAHHAVANSSDCDPEVQFMPFIATSPLHFEHTKPDQTPTQRRLSSVSKQLVSYQHLSFIPLLCFARYKFYAQSLNHWATGKLYIGRWPELASLVFFFVWYGALTAQLPTWRERLIWIVLSHASDFILYLQTVITHFPREISPGVKADWIEGQMVATLNWSCPPWLDWYHGGLQFQIEHHLFPRIPRHNLRRASLIVRPFLDTLGMHYHCPTFLGAISETFDALKLVAMEARLPLVG